MCSSKQSVATGLSSLKGIYYIQDSKTILIIPTIRRERELGENWQNCPCQSHEDFTFKLHDQKWRHRTFLINHTLSKSRHKISKSRGATNDNPPIIFCAIGTAYPHLQDITVIVGNTFGLSMVQIFDCPSNDSIPPGIPASHNPGQYHWPRMGCLDLRDDGDDDSRKGQCATHLHSSGFGDSKRYSLLTATGAQPPSHSVSVHYPVSIALLHHATISVHSTSPVPFGAHICVPISLDE